MSTLETNSIAKYSGNNVSIDDSLNLKSYTTTQRDALTSAAGDVIYNSTTNEPQYLHFSYLEIPSSKFAAFQEVQYHEYHVWVVLSCHVHGVQLDQSHISHVHPD